MFKRVVNLPFKVLGKAARAVQMREDGRVRARYEEASASDEEAERVHTPKFDVPDDFQPEDMHRTAGAMQEEMKNMAFVDVRESNRAEQIPQSQHIPMRTMDIRLAELPPAGTPILIYCQDGEQSLLAVRFLRFRGIEEVWLLEGGLDAWKAANGPLESSS